MPSPRISVEVVCNACGETIFEISEGVSKAAETDHTCDSFWDADKIKIKLPDIRINSNDPIPD